MAENPRGPGCVDESSPGIAVGGLIVEDLAMVLALVLLPALATLQGGTGNALVSDQLPLVWA